MLRNILIVDDDSSLRLGIKRTLDNPKYKIVTTYGFKDTKELDPNLKLDLAIVDLNLNDGKGTDLISELKNKHPNMQSILITGEHSIHITIAQAINQGIFYFIPKPFESSALINLVQKALKQKELIEQNKNLKSNIKKQFHFKQIIGQSSLIVELTEWMHKVAKCSSNILITGESGTGKELVARSIHCSQDSDRPFISVNCGAIPKELLESEFFGHVKGSFTGAVNHHRGYFSASQDGTLFLDEIGTMDLSLQVKLLRVLQEKTFRPIGSVESVSTNARIISATNIDLEKAIEKGLFRKDLYYRLNIIPIRIAPLRERKEDIPLLVQHFLKKLSKNKINMSETALNNLCHYKWPGNIRELENLIERLCVFKETGEIQESDLPEKYLNKKPIVSPLESIEIPKQGLDFNKAITNYENSLLLKALKKTNWNKRRAALLLNLNRTTLLEKIKKKGLQMSYDDIL
ncbi:MAG: sigma-54 dependent transcriptional regulator [Bdellovibrionaceae bacterium]|nr:sigma-54 dependent transcriptional regulator [Pseudobdellovibrionaceae bacterium]